MRKILFIYILCAHVFLLGSFDLVAAPSQSSTPPSSTSPTTPSIILDSEKDLVFYYYFASYDPIKSVIKLQDGSEWGVAQKDVATMKRWTAGNRLKIYRVFDNTSPLTTLIDIDGEHSNSIRIENIDIPGTTFSSGIAKQAPFKDRLFIKDIQHTPADPKRWKRIVLSNGYIFEGEVHEELWRVDHPVIIFHDENNQYALWNLEYLMFHEEIISREFTLVGRERSKEISSIKPLEIEDVINIKGRLDKRVLAQTFATEAVSEAIITYSAGIKDPVTPVAVFLFLGPTGVGKTELAKVLADELYHTQHSLIRFDMSHFEEPHAGARLIGSPPGYVNHEEGGQLTEALKRNPQSVVLLDEMEKANPVVRKMFLPIFDEGYVVDNKNNTIRCNDVVFIMTSNLAAQQIFDLFNRGLDKKQILSIIEPHLMEMLSPELYNRVVPIVFQPLSEETINRLVDHFLDDVIKRMKTSRDIEFVVDDSAKIYLAKNGYHPALGARPLKRLVQSKVVSTAAYAILRDNIPPGSRMTLFYDEDTNTWDTTFQ